MPFGRKSKTMKTLESTSGDPQGAFEQDSNKTAVLR